ncbi:MAG: GCN5-related N-acetyltransferase, partial [Frankiales bacterium]|nr:GCN5-related N-acetyltransferase [Frankiales bacterium]
MVDLVQSVAALGGAIGWLSVPPAEEVDAWLSSVESARVAIATEGDRVVACGLWRRNEAQVLERTGRIWKVMTHPDARRTGAGRAVMELLIA